LHRRDIVILGKIADAQLKVVYQLPEGRLRHYAIELDVYCAFGRDAEAQFLVSRKKAINL
jgi:hypothetical protein